jgi:excisionase family DNA binding protein
VRVKYRIRVARTDIAERTITATDEEGAIAKMQAELDKPYGVLGQWKTRAIEIMVEEVPTGICVGAAAVPEGPMLMSVKDAATHLGVSRGMMYEFVNTGEVESLRIGSRRLISRDALTQFIEAAGGRDA